MRLSYFKEAPLIRAHLLINQEKSKKGFKSIQPEISKMAETFGSEFDKGLHKSLFEEINFKEIKTLLNNKNTKGQYFIQEFPMFVDRQDFVNIFSEILMNTKTENDTQEINDGLNKICKLSGENQLKILISFILSGNEKFTKDGKNLLLSKCKEIKKEAKNEKISDGTLQTLLLILTGLNEDDKDVADVIEYLENNCDQNQLEEIEQIGDVDKMLEIAPDDAIEVEKIFYEIGPMLINNNIVPQSCDLLNYDLDEKRLADFILFLIKHQNWLEDKENKYLNKIFLQAINVDTSQIKDDGNDKKTISWNLDNFYKMFKTNIDAMDKAQVMNSFDDPKFSIKDKKSFDFFIAALQKLNILTSTSQFFNFIFTKWNNELNQIEFFSFLLNNTQNNDQFSFKAYNKRKIKKNFDISGINNNSKSLNLIEAWSCIDLIEVLFSLSKGNYYMKVKELFEWPIQNIPEVLAFVLTSIHPDQDTFLYDELIQETLQNFLNNHMTSQNKIEELWNDSKDLIIKTLCNMYENSPDLMTLSKILDLTQKMKDSLLILVSCNYYNFAVNLGILSAKRDFLHLDKWLKERISNAGDDFIEALNSYIQTNVIDQCKKNITNKENILDKAQLTIESLAIILENLMNICSSNKFSEKTRNDSKETYKAIFELFDELSYSSSNREEIDRIADKIFKQMYKGEITVDEVIEKLETNKNSSNNKSTELYACMIHCILDEYRFYHQYPEKELTLAATLFGQVINHKLLEGVLESIALKYILEAIRKEAGLMFKFGTIALVQFIEKIQQWPTYLAALIETKQLKSSTHIYDTLIKKYNEWCNNQGNNGKIAQSNEQIERDEGHAKNKDSNGSISDSDEANKNEDSKVSHINDNTSWTNGCKLDKTGIDKKAKKIIEEDTNILQGYLPICLDAEETIKKVQQPTNEIKYTFKYIFNSFTNNNESEKANEIKKILTKNPDYINWFSNFFIITKICIGNVNIIAYNELIKEIDIVDLNKSLIKYSVYYIRKLLASNNLDKDVKEQNILKNLGGFLGKLTLARNRPIFARELDLKEIIFNAYESGKLTAIIGFTAKIMENIASSKIFHPQNPWVYAILSLLGEIRVKQNLKNSIQLKIEELFKYLKLDYSKYPSNKLLENYKVCANSQDFVIPINQPQEQGFEQIKFCDIYNKVFVLDNLLQKLIDLISGKISIPSSHGLNAPNNTPVNANAPPVIQKQELARILAKALNQVNTEVMQNQAEKVIEQSLITAKELLIKDFTFDNDEHKFKSAAISTIKALSGLLCNTTCKEMIRSNLKQHLRPIFEKNKFDIKVCVYIVEEIDQDFFDIVLPYIHNFVVKRATEKLLKDERIIEQIEFRKKNIIQEKPRKELIEKTKSMPKLLRPNKMGLTDKELKIYETFDKMREPFKKYEKKMKNNSSGVVLKLVNEAINQTHPTSQSIAKTYDLCMKNIQNLLEEKTMDDDEQRLGLEKALEENQISDIERIKELALITLQYCIYAAINSKSVLLNAYSELIKGWVKGHSEVAEEITHELFCREDIMVKFNNELHYSFLKKQIFSNEVYEKYFIQFLNSDSTCEIAKKLLQNFYAKKVITANQFVNIPSYKFNLQSESYYTLFSNNSKMISALGKNNQLFLDYKYCNAKDQAVYDRVSNIWAFSFKKIIDEVQPFEPSTLAKSRNTIEEFIKTDIFKKNVTVCIMMITEKCIRQIEDKGHFYVENEVMFFYSILYVIDPNTDDKLRFFGGILDAVFKTFHKDYLKSGTAFNQRPYYKLFYILISTISSFEKTDTIMNSQYKKIHYLMAIADLLRVLSPMNYPGFALAWLDLISAKHFVYNFLEPSKNAASKIADIPRYERYLFLIIDLLSYIKLNCSEIISDYNSKIFLDHVYKFIFLLCKSFPDFISSYYFLILQSLPSGSSFIQLKNLILSCCPSDIELPNALTEEIKEIFSGNRLTTILFNKDSLFAEPAWKKYIDTFVENKNEQIVDELIKKLNGSKKEKNNRFSIINSIVVYWSQSVLKTIYERKSNSNCYILDFYKKMMLNFDSENRDHLINSILNELRYPSIQTNYFAYVIIFICLDIQNEVIEEHIIKNLLERLVFKPHPWGLLLTFVNLMKNTKFAPKMQLIANKTKIQTVLENLLSNSNEKTLKNYMSN